ncbi:MAG: hypothetical protein ACTHZX_02585 [Microbacterium sp.]
MSLALAPLIRCNRGFGAWFWIVMGGIALITALAMLGSGQPPWVIALVGLAIALLYALTRSLLPRLTIAPAEQTIRMRRGTVPYSAIAAVDLRGPRKAGLWARLVDDDLRTLTRFAVAESLFAPATAEQWAALRHIVAVAADRIPQSHADPRSWADADRLPGWRGEPMSPAEAVAVIDAQIAWCEAGRRPTHRRAPLRALVSRVVVLR